MATCTALARIVVHTANVAIVRRLPYGMPLLQGKVGRPLVNGVAEMAMRTSEYNRIID